MVLCTTVYLESGPIQILFSFRPYMVEIKCYQLPETFLDLCTKLHKLLFSAVLIRQIVQNVQIKCKSTKGILCTYVTTFYSYFKKVGNIYFLSLKLSPMAMVVVVLAGIWFRLVRARTLVQYIRAQVRFTVWNTVVAIIIFL